MAKVSPLINNFSGGEFSPTALGRSDIERYQTGLSVSLNNLPTVEGACARRPGTKFVTPNKDPEKTTRLLKFKFSVNDAYQMEFGDGYVRFYRNHQQVTVSGVAAWLTTTGYERTDLVVNDGVNYYCIQDHTSSATDEPGVGVNSDDYWYPLEGDIYEIPSPYSDDDLLGLKYQVQLSDVIYFVHGDHPPRKLLRRGNTDWEFRDVVFIDGPYTGDRKSTV